MKVTVTETYAADGSLMERQVVRECDESDTSVGPITIGPVTLSNVTNIANINKSTDPE